MAKKIMVMTVFCLFAACGCNSTKVPENAVALNVSFEWPKPLECSTISPAILVTNIPDETKYLQVEMVDLNMKLYDHGGGEVPYDGSDTIQEGTLKSYDGPCPPPGKEHAYEITVKALSADRQRILGHGKAMRKFKKEG